MRLGFHIARFDLVGGPAVLAETLARVGAATETVGADNLSLMDHYFQMEPFGGPAKPMLEGYTSLGFLAAHTSTVELQLLVTGVTYRHPGLLAKIVTTLDVLSGGRAMLGIGAAWYEREHRGLGVPFPPLAERFERLEETLQIVHQMWSDDDGPYAGRHYQLAETVCVPRPLQNPRPPIMIGGSGERKTLRLVAAYADACNLFAGRQGDLDAIRAKLDVLRDHCAREGTDIDRIRRTITWTGPVDLSVSGGREFVDGMARYAEIGVQEVHLMPPTDDPVDWIERVGRTIVPGLAQLP